MKKVLLIGTAVIGGAMALGFGAGVAVSTVGMKKASKLVKDGAEFINKMTKDNEKTEETKEETKEDMEEKLNKVKDAIKETEEKIEKIVKEGEA